MQLYEFKETQERVILIGVQTGVGDDVEASLDELDELAQTAGAETAAKVIQNREAVHPGTYIGKGKIEEVASLLRALDANGVICDDELSPSQLNNLERELDCKVMDRTLLILDIFAGRAVSSEGKIQVELAQLRYRAARLVGLRESLSRLGGGIGTRGPGEKKLETDRRLIRTRISALKAELAQVESFGKGRGVYISGLPYSFKNSRVLYRAVLWSASAEKELHCWYSTNYNVEVHAYVKNGKYCVVNNTYEPQDTTVYRGDGSSFELHLEANEIKWYQI